MTSTSDEEQPGGKNENSGRDYDAMLTMVGEFGRFQRILYALSLLVNLSLGLDFLGYVFLSTLPNHWCASPELNRLNLTVEQQKWMSLPVKVEEDALEFSQCQMYQTNLSTLGDGDQGWPSNHSHPSHVTTMECQHGWDYDIQGGRDSFASEWNLVCNRRFLAGVTQSAFMAGVIVGMFVSGGVADRFGRRPTVMVGTAVRFVVCLLCVPADNVWLYALLRFLVAVFGFGAANALFVLIMEIVGSRWRKDVGVAKDFFWVASFLVIAGLAYVIPHWRHLQLGLGLITILNFPVLIMLPESPRWLYAQGRTAEAVAVLSRIARWNKRNLEYDENGTGRSLQCNIVVPQQKEYVWDIFRYRLRKKVFVICFTWFAGDLVYYAISLNSVYLGSNPYLSFALSGLIEAPAYVFCLLALNRLGRRPVVIAMMGGCGLALVVSSVLPSTYQKAMVALSTTVKFCVTAAYSALYVYTVEFFPTLVRTSGVGFASFVGRLGGLLAPQIALLIEDHASVLLGVFGGLSLLSCLLVFLVLPETSNAALADTLQDAENRNTVITAVTSVKVNKLKANDAPQNQLSADEFDREQ